MTSLDCELWAVTEYSLLLGAGLIWNQTPHSKYFLRLISLPIVSIDFEFMMYLFFTCSKLINQCFLSYDVFSYVMKEECFASSQLKDLDPFVDKVSLGFSW